MKRVMVTLIALLFLVGASSCATTSQATGRQRAATGSLDAGSEGTTWSANTSSEREVINNQGSTVMGTYGSSTLGAPSGQQPQNAPSSGAASGLTGTSAPTSSTSGNPTSGGNNMSSPNSFTASASSATSPIGPAPLGPRYRDTRDNKPADGKYKNVNILCIGDSITQGQGSPSGYRYQLYKRLYQYGCTFSLVGPSTSETDPRLPKRYQGHAGVGGRKIAGVTEQLNGIINRDFDVAVILIGTNDMSNLSGVKDDYRKMLTAITEKKPDAYIFCVQITPNSWGATDTQETFNQSILPDVVAEFQNSGKRVSLVYNDSSKYESWMFGDSVHPNEDGNEVLADAICEGIVDRVLFLCDQGDSNYKPPVRVKSLELKETAISLEQKQSQTLQATVSPSDAEIFTVLWSTSDETIATVDSYGKVKAVNPGTATITAKTMDGGYTKTCKVTVTPERSLGTPVFSDNFSSKDAWTGDTDAIQNHQFSMAWQGKAKTITTKDSITPASSFCIEMRHKVTGNESTVSNHYASLKFGEVELRIQSGGTKILLYQGGTYLGSHTNFGPNGNETVYRVIYRGGQFTVTSDGETVIKAKAKSAVGTGKISISLGDYYRESHVYEVNYYKL